MFHCFLLSWARVNIVIMDERKKPLNFNVPFVSYREQIHYDVIVDCMCNEKVYYDFLKVVEVIYNYTKQLENDCFTTTSVLEIKILFATYITTRLRNVKFNLCMLFCANEFDNELLYHWHIILSFDLFIVLDSVKKSIAKYYLEDYVINKSMSYVYQVYTVLIVHILSYKDKQKDKYDYLLQKFLYSESDLFYQYAAPDECYETCHQSTTLDFALPDLFTQNLAYKNAIKWLQHDFQCNIETNIVYSKLDILRAAKNLAKYENREREFMENEHEDFFEFFSQNKNFKQIYDLIEDILDENIIRILQLWCRNPAKYELFFNENGTVCENYSLDDWKRDTKETIDKISNIDYLLLDWIEEVRCAEEDKRDAPVRDESHAFLMLVEFLFSTSICAYIFIRLFY